MSVRAAAVAGTFYPRQAGELRRAVEAHLAAASAAGASGAERPTRKSPEDGSTTAAAGARPARVKAVIAPHAGYVYSGPTAGYSFARLRGEPGVRRVVIIGPAHRVPVRGVALPGSEAFETPLGVVPVDEELASRIAGLGPVTVSRAAHAPEHSLEVELPFLQVALEEGFTVLPLVVGAARGEEVAQVLETVWGGDETRVVISSDLSHYHDYETARRLDGRTAEQILGLDARLSHDQACGATPVNGLLVAARGRGMEPRLLDLRNSGDTAGDRRQVVGYGAFAFLEAA